MTACVNKKSKRVAAVVTASLVGALSIGAPAVALATTDANIDMLAVSWKSGLKVTKATNGKNGSLSGDLATQTFVQGTGEYLVPVETTNSNGDVFSIDSDEYVLNFYKGESTKRVATTDLKATSGSIKEASEYFLTASPDLYYVRIVKGIESAGSDYSEKIPFRIVAEDSTLKGVYACENGDASDKTFAYKGEALSVSFAAQDGSVLNDSDYDSVEFVDALGKSVNKDAIEDSGTYTATLKKSGVAVATVIFNVEKYDLANSALTAADVLKAEGPAAQVDFLKAATGLTKTGKIKVASVSGPDGKPVDFSGSNFFGNKSLDSGKYTVSLTTAEGANLVAGSNSVSFYVLDEALSGTLQYDGEEVSGNTIMVNLNKGEAFDASKVSFKTADATYSGDQLELVFKKGEKVVTAEDVAKAGVSTSYTMDVRVKPVKSFTDNLLRGWSGQDVAIKVTGAEVEDSKNVAFYLNGELAGSNGKVTYDGTDALKKLTVSIKADGKTYEQGKDYTLEVKNTDTNKVVTEAVDAGNYEVTVKPITFSFKSDSHTPFSLVVDQVDLAGLLPVTVSMETGADPDTGKIDLSSSNSFYVAYTGKAVAVPALKYEVKNGKSYSYVDLDSKLYNVVSIKQVDVGTVKDAVKEGKYEVTLALTKEAEKNYKNLGTFTFEIKEFGHFADVDSAEWYSVAVEKAYDLNYVNGISGTNLFAPKADITRADAVCILFNMASGKIGVNTDFSYSEDTGYVTGFSDVDGKAYYAKALAWAKASGVANGSNGQFRPYDKITREEFASLLANFAKSKGDYEAVDADEVLGSATDYSAWAKQNVAWAKANKIMGNGGFINGTGNITRAEVAAMAVNYQPEALPAVPEN